MANYYSIFNIRGLKRFSSSSIFSLFFKSIIFIFLASNILFKFYTVFYYNEFIKALFIVLTTCCVFIILSSRHIKILIFIFGFSFFLFGFRPYDVQSQVFEFIVSLVAITLFFQNLKDNSSNHSNRHIIILLLSYITLSFCSLFLMPIKHIIFNFSLFGLKSSLLQIFNTIPSSSLYPIAGVNRLILFFIFAFQLSSLKNNQEVYRTIFIGIFCGAVLSVVLGLLDFYGIISLAWYRFGTIISPG